MQVYGGYLGYMKVYEGIWKYMKVYKVYLEIFKTNPLQTQTHTQACGGGGGGGGGGGRFDRPLKENTCKGEQ